jgi:serine/threonine protein kinase
MGPNGSGKSTLANTCFNSPRYIVTEGNIIFDGEDITNAKTDYIAKKGLFMSFQTPEEIEGITLASFIKSSKKALTGEKPNMYGVNNISIPQNISFSAKSFLLLMLQKKGNERLSVEDLLRHDFINNYNGLLNNKKELNYYPYTENIVSKTKSIFRDNPNNLSELRFTIQPKYANPTVKVPQNTKMATPIKASKFISNFNTESKNKDRFTAKSRYDFSTINPIHPGFRAKFAYESKTVDKSQPIRTNSTNVATQPSYKQYKIGNKINGNQLKIIVNCCKKYYLQMKGREGTAMKASLELKQVFGGNWIVFISNLKCKQFDFNN